MSYKHSYRIRYVDCDAQKVVYNAHYLTFVDDAVDCWLRELAPDFEDFGFEVMVKSANLVWHSSARVGEVIDLFVTAARWGNSSFDLTCHGSVDDRPVFDCTITYVCVDPDQYQPIPIPALLRSHLE